MLLKPKIKAENKEFEKLKIFYEKANEEMNRYRDWPINIFKATSFLYSAVITGSFFIDGMKMNYSFVIIIIILLSILYFWTFYLLRKNHLNYLEQRNVIIQIQKYWELQKSQPKIFPEKWLKNRPIHWSEGFSGWGYYAFFITILYILSIYFIAKKIILIHNFCDYCF